MLSFNQGSIFPRPSGILYIVFFLIVISSGASFAQDVVYQRITVEGSLTIQVEPAVLVACSEPGETRWGWYQFPGLSRLPDGRILCAFNKAHDAVSAYGSATGKYISSDEGLNWKPSTGLDRIDVTSPHASISRINRGEYLMLPSTRALELDRSDPRLPEPVGEFSHHGDLLFMIEDCPDFMKDYLLKLGAFRYKPRTGTWIRDTIGYDGSGALAWARPDRGDGQKILLARPWFEKPLLNHKDEILYAEYRHLFIEPDGYIPGARATSLMVSTDNGKSFSKRSTIGIDREGKVLYGEPTISETTDGRLVCIMRRQAGSWQNMKPMAISFSDDDGYHWTESRSMDHQGVSPILKLLKNGVLVLGYGRPGAHLIFSADGTGREWTEPVTLRKGDPDSWLTKTCGYLSVIPLDDHSILVAYSDFEYMDKDGNQCKAILVRRVTVTR